MIKVIAFIGEAGSGKDTLLRRVVTECPSVHEIVSCTTRPPREGEVDGVNYHFLTGEEFGEKVLRNEMLEATCFNDWFYGTSIDALDKEKMNLCVLNPAGVESMLQYNKQISLTVFYIQATEKERLIRQLNRETNPDIDEVIRRLKADRIDFSELDFDYIPLSNNTQKDLERNVTIIKSVIKGLSQIII